MGRSKEERAPPVQRTPTGREKTSTEGFLATILHGGEGKGKGLWQKN